MVINQISLDIKFTVGKARASVVVLSATKPGCEGKMESGIRQLSGLIGMKSSINLTTSEFIHIYYQTRKMYF